MAIIWLPGTPRCCLSAGELAMLQGIGKEALIISAFTRCRQACCKIVRATHPAGLCACRSSWWCSWLGIAEVDASMGPNGRGSAFGGLSEMGCAAKKTTDRIIVVIFAFAWCFSSRRECNGMMYTYTGFSCSVNLFSAQERLGRVCVQFFESQRPRAQHGPAHLVRTHSFASVRGIRLSVLNPCRTGGPHQCANMNCRVGAAHHVVSHCEHQQRRAFDKQFELVHSSWTCGRRHAWLLHVQMCTWVRRVVLPARTT